MRLDFAAIIFVLSHTILHAQGTPEPVITVSGSVTDSVTGRGISGALVILEAGPGKAELAAMNAQLGQGGGGVSKPFPGTVSRRAVTDESGKYSFAILEPTFASVRASHSGYLEGFNWLQGDVAQGISVKLVPTGVIEGRVVSSDGEPLPGATVEMIQAHIEDGRKIFRPVTSVTTNDLGEFRFWNIRPGSVYLRVASYQGLSTAARAPDTSEAFPSTFFPAAADRESASPIRVPPGQTVRADFSMNSRKSYSIQGVIKDAGSYTRVRMRLINGEDTVGNRVAFNAASGEFQVYGVTSGAYTLQAFSSVQGNLALAEANVVIGEQDLTGVVLILSTGVDVHGVIEHMDADPVDTLHGDDSDADSVPRNARQPARGLPVQAVILQPGRFFGNGTQPPAMVDIDGHFTFKDMLPNKYAFTLFTGDEYIESIRSGTIDVLANGLQVGLASPEELRVTLRRGGGSIRGDVTGLGPGQPATVALIRSAGAAGVPTIAQTFTDGTGAVQFVANNLAPGEYLLYSWPATQEVEYRNPEALRALSGSTVAVSLHDHGAEQVNLRVASMETQ
jgi:hypothetical protein